jgi:Co/Zn/Cd efflux system component
MLFLIIETTYAYLADSLSLITDALHMLCDLIGLIIGLLVSYIKHIYSKTKLNKSTNSSFRFFISNIDSIAGLTNGGFLAIMSYNLFTSSYKRIAISYPELMGSYG